MKMLSLSASKALNALATYQFLTAQQMANLGVGRTAKQVRDSTLKKLLQTRRPLIEYKDYGVIAGIGRLARIHYLTPYGVNIVAEMERISPDEITYPKDGAKFQQDYFHRLQFVDFHIGLRQWIDAQEDAELEFFHSYYTKRKVRGVLSSINKHNFKNKNRLPVGHRATFEPDGVFRFDRGEKTFLCALEVHRKPDSLYIARQLDQYITAIDQNLLSDHYGQDAANLVLSVHDSKASFNSVRKRLLAIPDFERYMSHFHFAVSEEIEKNFTSWVTADGSRSRLF